ncbi:hypothetical protein L484_010118 [Morus notabilis]|uniref:Uncharacterized protein n=1 Tax=Morus notabilis TaxID=981085 RepID=W9QLM2_9ROSA|nr:hypothetical protein L484_010118 [Morus notabilis]
MVSFLKGVCRLVTEISSLTVFSMVFWPDALHRRFLPVVVGGQDKYSDDKGAAFRGDEGDDELHDGDVNVDNFQPPFLPTMTTATCSVSLKTVIKVSFLRRRLSSTSPAKVELFLSPVMATELCFTIPQRR